MAQATGRKAEILSIPNLMSVFRMLLIPPLAIVLLKGQTAATISLLALSALTDVADGFIARKFHQVTQLGKILDPVADKLTLFVLAVCTALHRPVFWLLAGVMFIKETAMLVLYAIFLHGGGRAESARWYGKATTASIYAAILAMVLFPAMPKALSTACVALCTGLILFTGFMYIRSYLAVWRKIH